MKSNRSKSAPTRLFEKDAIEFKNDPENYNLSSAKFITETAAEELVRSFYGKLDLSGVTELEAKTAAIFSKCTASLLVLNGIKELTPELLQALKSFKGDLHLNGLISIDKISVEELVQYKSRMIYLEGLKEIAPRTLRFLIGNLKITVTDIIQQKAPKIITEDVAIRFSNDSDSMDISGALEITNGAANIFSQQSNDLDLRSLESLDDLSADSLSRHSGSIILDFKKIKISHEAARSLSKHNPKPEVYDDLIDILLRDTITKEAAEWLKDHYSKGNHPRGYFSLGHGKNCKLELAKNSKYLSDEASAVLSSIDCEFLDLGSIESITEESAKRLSSFKGQMLHLDGLMHLTAAAALHLARLGLRVSLPDPERFSSDVQIILLELNESNQRERARLYEEEHLEKLRQEEEQRVKLLEREELRKLQEIEINSQKERAREETLQRNYTEALDFLEHFGISYPKENTNIIFKSILSFAHKIFGEWEKIDPRIKIIKIAEECSANYSDSISRDKRREYIILKGLRDKPDNLIHKLYLKRFRETRCFSCKTPLKTKFDNECLRCNWIKCKCGSCGCNYSGYR